jgi:hypothetical protein
MDPITSIFSHLCGQGRCFIVDGSPLPVCQRCLGLYVGAALTMAWLIGTGLWRRGLPSGKVAIVQMAALGLAMMGGMHVIDTGPSWRLACGLWTGHVCIIWSMGGSGALWRSLRTGRNGWPCWPARRRVEGMLFVPAFGLLSMASGLLPVMGWAFWAAVICVGAISLALAAGTSLSLLLASATWASIRIAARCFRFGRRSLILDVA